MDDGGDHEHARPRGHWQALAALLAPFKGRVVALGAIAAVGATLPLVGPLLLKLIIDRAVEGAATADLLVPAGFYVGVAVVSQVIAIAVLWAATKLTWNVTDAARVELTGHVLDHELAFHHTKSPGELVERVDGDLTAVSDHLANFAVTLMSVLFTLGGMVIVVSVIDWRIGVALLGYIAVASLVFTSVKDKAVSASENERGAMARLYSGIEERLVGADDLRANGGGAHAMNRFSGDARRGLHAAVARERQIVWLWHGATGVVIGGAVFSLAIGAAGVKAGWISVGTAFLVLQYTQLLHAPLEQIIDQLQQIQKAAGAMLRVRALLLSEPARPREAGTPVPEGAPAVVFEDVEFSYGDEAVLQGLSIDIKAGRSVGVVGATGGGKTTLGRLVTRSMAPDAGHISIGGIDLAQIGEADLRRLIGVVPQDVVVFDASLRDNITLFDPSPTDAEVQDALDKVGLSRLADVPEGLHRRLTGDGGGLSAGEAQLVALSRVFLRDPAVVLLDEATSRVDPETEQLVLQSITRLLEGRTAIVIAHRLATLERVDEIAVLQNGIVAEHDARDALLADDSTYARLVALTAATEGVEAP
ncbi:MAG: ABC transporter ATP-binding protein [Actinomycetota bacterium]